MSTWNGDPSYYLNNTLIAESSFISTNYTATAIPPNYVSITGGYAPPSASGDINIVAGTGISASKIDDKTYQIGMDESEIKKMKNMIEDFDRKFEELRGAVFMAELKASNSYHYMCHMLGLDPNPLSKQLSTERKKDKPRPPDNDDDVLAAMIKAKEQEIAKIQAEAAITGPPETEDVVASIRENGAASKEQVDHVLDVIKEREIGFFYAPYIPIMKISGASDLAYNHAMKILDV